LDIAWAARLFEGEGGEAMRPMSIIERLAMIATGRHLDLADIIAADAKGEIERLEAKIERLQEKIRSLEICCFTHEENIARLEAMIIEPAS
jgi:hypothetical protein